MLIFDKAISFMSEHSVLEKNDRASIPRSNLKTVLTALCLKLSLYMKKRYLEEKDS